ncbi:MAG: GTP-binding protein, partial [Sphingopyxis sp.]|nr:GTP-binding protein [Sphingopyxis sp.]
AALDGVRVALQKLADAAQATNARLAAMQHHAEMAHNRMTLLLERQADLRIDLIEADGLADLLAAETESQRRQAMLAASGHVSQRIDAWQNRLLSIAAAIEAALDFADEDDVAREAAAMLDVRQKTAELHSEVAEWLVRPAAERIRDGLSVVIAGPPNAGKSTLLNALAQREVAIVSPLAGTTRDIVEVPLALDGIAMRFADTAGLRDDSPDAIERIGVDRASAAIAAADILLWLGVPDDCPPHGCALRIAAQADVVPPDDTADLALSAKMGAGLEALHTAIVARARDLVPGEGEAALHSGQRAALADAAQWLAVATGSIEAGDAILLAERIRLASAALNRLTGKAGVEDMLDTLFGRFCIGK